jgi:malate dehydrogenase (oxaloacetate-decarboxylating)
MPKRRPRRRVTESELTAEYIIPNALDLRVPSVAAASVAGSAAETGPAGVKVDPDKAAAGTREYVYEGRLVPLE